MSRSNPFIMVPLSKLVLSRQNVRQVKPDREAHRRFVASIRAFGVIEPLVVRSLDDKPGWYVIVAGHRRLAALRVVHRKTRPEPKILCMLREVDDHTAEAISLSENFTRERMHPLDEAEAFARLAGEEGKFAESIAADFGVKPVYVRQRMKLATLHDVVKFAYREQTINTEIAEAFASVPPERQAEVWQEIGGAPRHADHVRNVIANNWIDASHALFDLAALPEATVSRDLFSERVLVERRAFMEAQVKAVEAKQQVLQEDGWAEVIVGAQADIQDRLYAMDSPEPEYDPETSGALSKIEQQREKWESKLNALDADDDAKADGIQQKIEALDDDESRIIKNAKFIPSEATKAAGTAFLILDPDGRVRQEYRMPRRRSKSGNADSGNGSVSETPALPTSDDLKDGQLASTFAHESLAVRKALLENPLACKRVLLVALHDKVKKEAIALRHDTNGTNVYVEHTPAITSPALDWLRKHRQAVEVFTELSFFDEGEAYARIARLSEARLDKLIAVVTAESLTSHPQHRPKLMSQLAKELQVNVRTEWRPDATWLGAFQKAQLAHLMRDLFGPLHCPDVEQRKKSELVDALVKLFTDAAEGKLEDAKLAERVNLWLPASLRDDA